MTKVSKEKSRGRFRENGLGIGFGMLIDFLPKMRKPLSGHFVRRKGKARKFRNAARQEMLDPNSSSRPFTSFAREFFAF